ncbi:MAG: GldG family protein [Verrucomicrobiota bacterium]|nr:GldG family protein [Verrucomicrobiota bacterium]
MEADPKTKSSFSPHRRWRIGCDLLVRTAAVLAVVVMANYLGAQLFHRFYLSAQTSVHLSLRTISVLHSLTNRVTVTLYYDKDDDMFPTVKELLEAYRDVNPQISLRVVDYTRDAGEAEKLKAKYGLFQSPAYPNGPPQKNLIIFDCGGRFKVVPGAALAQYTLELVNPKDREFRKKPEAFLGEEWFTAALLAITNPKPFKAYYVQGEGEPALDDSSDTGYVKFASVLRENYIDVEPLRLTGASPVPADCDLLIIAGARMAFSPDQLRQIDQYLSQGGRLLALFDYWSLQRPSGLGDLLARYGVNVGRDVVRDPNSPLSYCVIVSSFSQHPVVNPLMNLALQMVMPRPIGRTTSASGPADAPKVQEIAFSGPDSVLAGARGAPPRAYPLIAAVEQPNAVKGVAPARDAPRLVVAGDAFFLDNQMIAAGANRDFLGYAVNWLLDRPALLKGIGPRPVTEYRLVMTRTQQNDIRWLLLAALPGAVLLLGGLVWLVRRK